jgi:hypothetical protein
MYDTFIIQQLSEKLAQLPFLNLENVNIFQCFYTLVSTFHVKTNKIQYN